MNRGNVYVTRISYNGGTPIYPDPPNGSTRIVVMMKSHSKWYPLSPYYLKTKEGFLIENAWQFQKIYEVVPYTKEYYSRYDKTVIWEWPEERHVSLKPWNLLPEYYKWRQAGFFNKYPVRYPVGFKNKSKVLCSITNDGELLDYISARKKIYLPLYIEAVRKEPQYQELLNMIKSGINIAIYEVDGPHQESLDYYKKIYNVDDSFIQNSSMLITNKNIEIMLNDPKHSFGHGYCLGWSLITDLI